ncbi:glycoside hydrolase family 31 protein [Anaerocolumna jejuensis]|uniref:glycoside hydrolase family 31 protein n=1 Tax=Anaerocolumna jejuensis TaxID=259063 RepID=UPI003F7BEF62
MSYFRIVNKSLVFKRRHETLMITPWGENSFRVRGTENTSFTDNDWALYKASDCEVKNSDIQITEKGATITNGNICARLNAYGKLSFYNQRGELLLKEYYRSWEYGTEDWEDLDQIVMIRAAGREYKGTASDNYHITVKFEADDREHLFGMGQYQHPYLDLKGCSVELAQRNTQASVPFAISSLGYGFLWNNPAIGKANFSKNITEWEVYSSKQVDYWITAGDTPAEIEESYAAVTGTVPMMPDYAMGFWQCKLRYQTQEELLEVAREYYRRKLPVKVIVVDFFHWPNQGDWTFDEEYWPDPKAMIKELEEMGIKLMVSVWPTVDRNSINYREMAEKDLLVRADRGLQATMECFGTEVFFDATNPEARKFIWDKCKENYLDKGVTLFWLDEAEPEYTAADFDIYRYYQGSALECANIYPAMYAKAFYDGMREEGVENPINLIRCAWAGSQRFGALAWSGDVPSTFAQLKNQMTAGLNMGLAGITWWTADIGGFHGGNIHDPKFHELLIRWFQFGTFCPVMRLHGDRDPHDQKPLGTKGGGMCASGAFNEIWSYTPKAEEVMTKYIQLRERLKPYITEAMKEAHEKGTPVIKPLFYDFSQDDKAWLTGDCYLFGHDLLVAPVTEAGAVTKSVYLPMGTDWIEAVSGKAYEGGQTITVDAPLETIPVFARKGSEVIQYFRF